MTEGDRAEADMRAEAGTRAAVGDEVDTVDRERPAVVAEQLTKQFDDFTAVDGVSFSVPRGDIFGFLGPNGAGKTTTIRMLLGLLQPTSGAARVLDIDVVEEPHAVQQRIGYMSQRFSLYGDLTVSENISFYGRTYGVTGDRLRERHEYALNMTGLEGKERELTRNLAGGFRQRLALACAILHEPEVLFLDEPTAGVDPISRRAFWDFLYELAEERRTIFVTTHYMDEAENCRHLAFITRGRIIVEGTPAEIKARMRGEVLEIMCDRSDAALASLRAASDAGEISFHELALYGARVHAVADDVGALRPQVAQILERSGVSVTAMDVIAPSLEDVFIASVRAPAEAPAAEPAVDAADAPAPEASEAGSTVSTKADTAAGPEAPTNSDPDSSRENPS